MIPQPAIYMDFVCLVLCAWFLQCKVYLSIFISGLIIWNLKIKYWHYKNNISAHTNKLTARLTTRQPTMNKFNTEEMPPLLHCQLLCSLYPWLIDWFIDYVSCFLLIDWLIDWLLSNDTTQKGQYMPTAGEGNWAAKSGKWSHFASVCIGLTKMFIC